MPTFARMLRVCYHCAAMLKLLEMGLTSPRKWIRLSTTVAICLAVGMTAGALLGYLGPLLSIALLAGIAAALLTLRSLQIGLYILIGIVFLLPFAALPVDIGFSPTLLDLILAGLFFVWIAKLATRQQGRFIATPIGLPVLAFILLACASFISGLAHAPLTTNVLRHFAEILLGISLFFLIVNHVRTDRELTGLVKAIILAGFGMALIGVILYFLPKNISIRLLSALRVVHYPSGPGVLRYIEDDPELPLRAISTSVDPNILGGMLILTTAITLPQLFAKRPLLSRRWVAIIVGTMIVCLLLTFSRGSFVGLGVALISLGITRHRKLLLVLLAILLALLLLPQGQVYIQHLIEGVRGEDLATQMRFGEYKDALTLISRYPWFGVGFAGTPDIDTYLGVSSVYLLIAEEMGVTGLLSFILVLLLCLSHLWRATRSAHQDDTLAPILLGLQTALIGAMIGGIFDHYLFNLNFPHAAAIFWVYIGLSMAATRLTSPN